MASRVEGLASRGPATARGSRDTTARLLTGTSNETLTTNKLEKHLADYRSGNGNLSKETAASIFDKDGLNGSFLASKYPKLLASYSGYSSGLRYDQRSRFVKGVNGANDTLESVLSARERSPTAQEIEQLYTAAPDSAKPRSTDRIA